MKTTNLSTLKIHKLSQEQYDRELAAGRIDENAIYLTPDEHNNVDPSDYASITDVDDKVESHNTSTTAHNDIRLAINEINTEVGSIKTSVSDGKAMIASAITSKGVQTASDATFETMANNIAAINAGGGTEEDEPTDSDVTYDLTLEIGKLSRTDGSELDAGDGLRIADFIPTPDGATVAAIYSLTDPATACFLCYDENYNLIKDWNIDSEGVYSYQHVKSGGGFEVPSGTSYVRAYWSTTDTSGTIHGASHSL
jgi:hypothetical protein